MFNRSPDTGCPVCRSQANVSVDNSQITHINCPVCGQFRLDAIERLYLPEQLQQSGYRFAYRISHALRTAHEAKRRTGGIFPIPSYTMDDFTKMIDQPDLPAQEKLHVLLRHLGKMSEFAGERRGFPFRDYSVIGLRNPEEAQFYIQMLQEQGFIKADIFFDRATAEFTVTGTGWLEIDRLDQTGSQSSTAFIAMWFDRSQDSIHHTIERAIAETGYIPLRIDRKEHLNRIDDEIIASIRGAKFLVAGFTGQRNGVYFEAGFMLGLGRPVIWICRKSQLGDVHFDTRQYNTIDYTDSEDLEKRLKNRIRANLGTGPRTSSLSPIV